MNELNQLLQTLTPDTLLLTANKRLSRWLHKQYHSFQKTTPYQTPNILPIQAWLENCWNTALVNGFAPDKIKLSLSQTKVLWQQVVSKQNENALLHISGTADFVEQAWALTQAWNISVNDKSLAETESGRTFQRWANQFSQECLENRWLETDSLIPTISTLIHNDQLKLPKKIVLLGFLEKPPALQQLIDTLIKQGITVDTISHQIRNVTASRIALQDFEAEITTMARWAKARFNERSENSIACIVPELNRYRSTVVRIFNELFGQHNNLFNISSGETLLKEPAAEMALAILSLPSGKININDLSHLLRSPFIMGSEKQFTQRALLDEKIRSIGNISYSLTELLALITDKTLAKAFNLLEQQQTPEKQLPSHWAHSFLTELNIFGWPGERSTNSREFQAITQFIELIQEFSQLDLILQKISRTKARQQLRQMVVNSLFQPQTTDAPIQVLGMLEITGLTFDSAWVMGLDHQSWPSKPKPNPFLPIQLQRKLQMPHASSDRELAFCQLITNQFLHCAKQVICSHSTHFEDQTLLPSPLIQQLPETDIEHCRIAPFQSRETLLLSSETVEHFIDNHAPSISEGEKVSGGTSIFKFQAECPFRAFATLRLKSKGISEPEMGLNALEKGIITHTVLELFWCTTKTQEKLLEYGDEELDRLIKWCIKKAIEKTLDHRNIAKTLIRLEKERLLQIIKQWLEIEKNRKPFKISTLEKWQKTKIGHIAVTMKADRIDQLDNDHSVVIDYKTGQTNISAWFGERLDEPQLPLYAISAQENISAIAFAQLKANQIQFNGIACEADLLPNVKALEEVKHPEVKLSWQEQLEDWSKNLKNLADDFYHGKASVDPKDPNQTCRYCDLKTLCRIYEKAHDKK